MTRSQRDLAMTRIRHHSRQNEVSRRLVARRVVTDTLMARSRWTARHQQAAGADCDSALRELGAYLIRHGKVRRQQRHFSGADCETAKTSRRGFTNPGALGIIDTHIGRCEECRSYRAKEFRRYLARKMSQL